MLGNTGNLSGEEVRFLSCELMTHPMLPLAKLEEIQRAAVTRANHKDSHTDDFKALAEMLADYIAVTDAKGFKARGEKISGRLMGPSNVELNDFLAELNALPDFPAVCDKLAELFASKSKKSKFFAVARKYARLRFERSLPPAFRQS